jgi:thiol-disulfide isomerase/thioredoxin
MFLSLIVCRRRAMSATVGFIILAGLCAEQRALGAAATDQPPASVQMLDESGHLIGNGGERIQVNVTGRVLDAETGQPLPYFYLTTGTQNRERTDFEWADKSRTLATQGAFAVTLEKEKREPAVLIEADGYLPQSSGPILGLETNLTFLLKKGDGPAGIVLTPEGRPAAGRTVYFARLKDLIYLTGSKLTPKPASAGIRSAVTDAAGQFSFAPDLDAFAVVVADDSGFAQVRVEDLRASPEVRLQPWAQVEGTLKIGAKPGTNETVRLADAFAPDTYYPRSYPPYAISVETKTDSAGHFVFPRVPPVDVKVFHAPKLGRGEAHLVPMTQLTNLTLKAGETGEVTLGGQGCPIVGRIVLKNYDKPVDWQNQVFWIESQAPTPPDCPNFDAINNELHLAVKAARNAEEKEAAQNHYLVEQARVSRQLGAYYSTAAGRQYWFSKRRYVLQFAQDGSYRIDDVPGGKYELTIDLRELDEKRGQLKSPLLALFRHDIVVPDSPGGRSDIPLDLDVINMLVPLHPGDTAPDFAAKTLDGQTVKLSDYRGKYVLLDFWATWSATSVAEMPELKETYTAFGNDPRFAMIGLNVDTNAASARAFLKENPTGWPQGYLGQSSDSAVPDRYGIETIPFVLLVDPNGKVAMLDLRGGIIKSAVQVALTAHE